MRGVNSECNASSIGNIECSAMSGVNSGCNVSSVGSIECSAISEVTVRQCI